MAEITELEEWQIMQQIGLLIHASIRYGIREGYFEGIDTRCRNMLDELSQETQMMNFSSPHGTPLPDALAEQCRSGLVKIIQCFEAIMDEQLITELTTDNKHPELGLQTNFSRESIVKYPRLILVITHAKDATIALFLRRALVSGASGFDSIIHSITEANRALLEAIPTRLIPITAPTRKECQEIEDNVSRLTDVALDKLQELLSQCPFGFRHQIMFRLAGLSQFQTDASNTTLDLLLNSCDKSLHQKHHWQDAKCSLVFTTDDNQPASRLSLLQDLCTVVHDCLQFNERPHFHLLEGSLHSISGIDNDINYSRISLGYSLSDMINSGFLLAPDWSSSDRLTIWEKRRLALNLGVLFTYLYDCKRTQHGWRAENLHFLDPLSLHQLENLLQLPPYLGCDISLKGGVDCVDLLFSGNPAFLAFSKLLADLEAGKQITATEMNRNGTPSVYLTLQVGLKKGQLLASTHYSNAIRGCLSLYRNKGDPTHLRAEISKKILYHLQQDLAIYDKPLLTEGRTQRVEYEGNTTIRNMASASTYWPHLTSPPQCLPK
ncbi:hypothetical protein GGR58DRAFT_207432 [Xylaria digitata]|nr:hypothetical protein GGR58DRAFT_207432 [Xylaria digitata]